ncbi:hypothetical protein [Streptomyces solicathayae]|uniref:Uncharacterized protein n=1 Tax=Streptomyces solicathayae TaxID=3081768 RepID=A0ABZ0LU91_9ACTN|nr:hypothetical protein [Streptomyces sp. HUAS YS2]WOX22334.1 hypothetical protein R2D22_13395 [Streptomyces sp. HUAS YS2]
MKTELVACPRADAVRSDLTEAPGWDAYAAELRRLLAVLTEASGAGRLEVEELIVSRPLPDRFAELRNGSRVDPAEAAELLVGMAAGEGPYCRLIGAGRLRIESGWDGAMHFYVTSETAEELAGFDSESLELGRRTAEPDSDEVENPVRGVADEAFWAGVRDDAGDVTLLCERWAHGAYGCRWFRVTRENVGEVAEAVRPRSLLSLAVDPDLGLDPVLLDDDFTAFRPPLVPGELAYRAFPGGADDLAEVTDDGFAFMLGESAPAARRAVVPDPDGIVRARWEDFDEA